MKTLVLQSGQAFHCEHVIESSTTTLYNTYIFVWISGGMSDVETKHL